MLLQGRSEDGEVRRKLLFVGGKIEKMCVLQRIFKKRGIRKEASESSKSSRLDQVDSTGYEQQKEQTSQRVQNAASVYW